MGLKYKGFFNHVNVKPGDFIEIFCSDWNKEFWAFYAFIDVDDYEDDVEAVNALISELNFRDGDVYVELINHSDDECIGKMYKKHYERGYMSHSSILDVEAWEEISLEPPTFNDFKDAWECQEYLEEFYGKERFYDIMYGFLNGEDIRLMYDKHLRELL